MKLFIATAQYLSVVEHDSFTAASAYINAHYIH